MSKYKKEKRILFLVHLPPPIHGVSVISKMVWNDEQILSDWKKHIIQLKFSENTWQLKRFSIKKLIRFISIFAHLFLTCCIHRISYAYFTIVPSGLGFYRDLFYVLILKVFNVTPIYHLHLLEIRQNSQKKLLCMLYKWSFSNSIVIHLSESVYNREFYNIKPHNLRVFIQSNGIPDIEFSDKNVAKTKLRIVHIAHLYGFKGIDVLLKVFLALIVEGYNLHLDIVGDLAEKNVMNEIQNYSRNIKLKDRITYHGFKTGEKKHKIINNADIMVLPTRNDTFPLTILEGMQHQIPVVATKIGAIPEIIEDGVSGLLFNGGDQQQLKEKLLLLIANENLRESMGKEARKKFLNSYTDQHFYNGLRDIFSSLE